MSALSSGQKFYAKSTETNRSCRIQPGDRGYITGLDSLDVRFYLERRGGAGYMEAVCSRALFGSNFTTDWRLGGLEVAQLADGGWGKDIDTAYSSTRAVAKRFPDSFMT